MAANRGKLIEWNDDAKALLKRIDGSIEAIEGYDFAYRKKKVQTLAWLKEIRQVLTTCDDVEFLGIMMSRYAEPLMYAAVETLDSVMDTVG